MIHPDTSLQFISPAIGYGVCAAKLIPKGTVVWVQDALDMVLEASAIKSLDPLILQSIDHYAFVDDEGRYVLCWDAGRFVNHSCDPTTVCVGKHCTIAARDIQPGEQITEDYATLNLVGALECLCGSPKCRSQVFNNELGRVASDLDARSDEAMEKFRAVPQPLLRVALPHTLAMLNNIADGKAKAPSCIDNMCPPSIQPAPFQRAAASA